MKLASHNSFTYAKPKGLFSKLFCFAGRCQTLSVYEQYKFYDVRMFDLRIFPKGDGYVVQHGPITFDSSGLLEALDYFNTMALLGEEDIYIRVLLEQNTLKKNQAEIDDKFIKICENFEKRYPHLKFICGRRKCDWKVIFEFKYNEPTITELYSSVTNLFKWKFLRKIDDLFPCLYAFFMNKKNLKKEYDTEFLMIDFIEIR